jgi:glycosyltransferase involved in cell wall biosynthesis
MKILVTTSVFPRWRDDATPPFVYNLCRDLVEAGCQVTVLAPHSKGSALREKVDGMEVVRYRYMWPLRYQTLCYEGGMIVRKRGNRWRMLQLPGLCIAQFAATRALMREGFDILHAHSLLPQGWIAALANGGKLPLVISSHGADVFLLGKKWRPLLKHAIGFADALIANSTTTRQSLQALGAGSRQVRRIPATPNYPDPAAPAHVPPQSPVILFAGRLIPEKGIDALLEALPLVRKEFPETTLRIAGSGVLENSLRDSASSAGLGDAVRFLGWLPPDQLRHEMSHATLLVAPSRMIEGQNLVVTEALSVGCPVATTPRGGVMDLVTDSATGFVISAPEPQAIAETVTRVMGDAAGMASAGRRGFEHFMTRFSRQRIVRDTLDLYAEVTGSSRSISSPAN